MLISSIITAFMWTWIFFYRQTYTREDISALTSMEQPINEPLSKAFLMMLYISLGASVIS